MTYTIAANVVCANITITTSGIVHTRNAICNEHSQTNAGRARIIVRARIDVVARRRVCRMLTHTRAALIIRANVRVTAIVIGDAGGAVHDGRAGTDSGGAHVVFGAWIVVVTVGQIRRGFAVAAAANVVRAGLPIIALAVRDAALSALIDPGFDQGDVELR